MDELLDLRALGVFHWQSNCTESAQIALNNIF